MQQCPKCSHIQPKEIAECERCGLIFAKYHDRQAWKEKEATPDSASLSASLGVSPPTPKGGGFPGIAIGLVLGLCLAGLYFLLAGQGKAPSSPSQPAQEVVFQKNNTEEAEQSLPNAASNGPLSSRASASIQPELIGLAKQLADSFPPGNPVEAARNATVLIKTPWGLGSGFFISRQGHVITNRHVVEFDEKTLNKLKADLEQLTRDLARAKEHISYLKKHRESIRGHETIQPLTEAIDARENEYSRYVKIQEELQQRLDTIMRFSPLTDVKVTLIDGNEVRAFAINMSKTHDLALLTTSAVEAPFIGTADSAHMQQGKKLFTIGNPAGLSYTVTSGIFSGYREYRGTRLIQTDAPINPGNSGGPLLDEEGQVLGVNTMILRDAQGIGFAIPFSVVLEEFRHLLGI
jgi:S1-C subfamily serine protease